MRLKVVFDFVPLRVIRLYGYEEQKGRRYKTFILPNPNAVKTFVYLSAFKEHNVILI